MALDLNDKSGNSNTLTNNNGATEVTTSPPFTPDTSMAAIALASSQYFSAVDSASLSITGDFTLQIDMKAASLPSGGNQGGLIYKSDSGSGQRSYGMSLIDDAGTPKLLAFLSGNGTTQNQIRWTWTPTLAIWYNVAVVATVANAAATQFEFFLNGVSQGNGTVAVDNGFTSVFDGTANLNLGAINNSPSGFFDGQLDNGRIYNIARTGASILGNYATELSTFTNVMAYWPFNPIPSPSLNKGNMFLMF